MIQKANLLRAPEPGPSSPERIADAITHGLMRHEYVAGQRLVEPDLMSRHEVSRSTVRESLKILASRGIVEIVPFRGATIRHLSVAGAADLLAVLEVLTGLAARLAAEKINSGNNAGQFAAAAKPLVQPPLDMQRVLNGRAPFYQCMLDIAGSAELSVAMPTSRAHLFRSQVWKTLTQDDLRDMVKEYVQISDAILAGKGERAEQLTRVHLQKSAQRSLPHLPRA